MDFDREHKLISVEVPATSVRKVPVVVLSVGIQGVLVDVFGSGIVSQDERLEWSSTPISSYFSASFLVSLIHGDSVEIHDIGTLVSLQKIKCGSPSSPITCLYALDMSAGGTGGISASDSVVAAGGTAYVCGQDNVQILEMIPLHLQVTRLVEKGDLEEALSICHANKGNSSLFEEIDLPSIHEKFGSVLYQKGDFDGAVDNYLAAGSDIIDVFSLFPDLIPPTVASLVPSMSKKGDSSNVTQAKLNIMGVSVPAPSSSGQRLSGAILHRAASAIVNYCEKKRPQVSADASQAEYRSRISLASGTYGSGATGNNSKTALMELLAEKAENVVPGSPEDLIRRSVLLDTVLVCSLVSSSPLSSTRRQAVIDVLADPRGNRCHIESCAVLLASQGNAFTEALLWLYRSHNEHKRVLSALTEDRCVGSGAWTRENFYEWMTSYLQWLWVGGPNTNESSGGGGENNDDNRSMSNSSSLVSGSAGGASSLESMVLPTLVTLLQYDAMLGMSVLTGVRADHLPSVSSPSPPLNYEFLDSSASRGDVSFRDVISFLQGISSPGNELSQLYMEGWSVTDNSASPMNKYPIPLVNGHALSVAYAEWVVDELSSSTNISNNVSSSVSMTSSTLSGKTSVADIVEEYAQLLMAGLKIYLDNKDSSNNVSSLDHSKNDLAVKSDDHIDVKLFKIYRSKLQAFLESDRYDYRPERMMKYLPQGLLHEYALFLSRLGSHDEVLTIYIHQLGEPDAAEAYCDRMYAQSVKRNQLSSAKVFSKSNTSNVYLSLIKAKLNLAVRSSGAALHGTDPISSTEALQQALSVAEKYFDRVDPCAVIDLLPPKSPVCMVGT